MIDRDSLLERYEGLDELAHSLKEPVVGMSPVVEEGEDGKRRVRLVPWQEAAQVNEKWNRGNSPGTTHAVPGQMVQAMHSNLPAEIRTTAREKYRELVKRLWTDVNLTFYKDGEIRWPASIKNEIAVLGIAQGKPDLAKQVEALARRYMVKGARVQQTQDAKRVTRDWHGHYSA